MSLSRRLVLVLVVMAAVFTIYSTFSSIDTESSVQPSRPANKRPKIKSEPFRPSVFNKDAVSEQKTDKSKYENFAIALKTGKDVARTRTPIQFMTFLKHVRKVVVIGESSTSVGDYSVIDVYDQALRIYNSSIPVATLANLKKRSDAVVPDNNSQGWKLDAHKNLPGIRVLYEAFPDAEWYLMIDDDTYVYFDNLQEMLKKYDYMKPFYLGQPNMFAGCDGVKKFGEGPNFAHGGTGIVMSRGAILKVMEILDKCIIKYKDCFAGDVRLGLCMRDAGILVQGPGNFNGGPPNDDFGWPSDPCDKPITFHHLLIDQTQSLFDVEKAQKVTYASVFKEFYGSSSEILQDVDLYGQDIGSQQVANDLECRQFCVANKKCRSFVFDSDKKCWLKESIPSRSKKPGFISGIIMDRYSCK